MTEFKQIIGRGTRVRDDYGKLYFNILDYTGSATRLFADPAFDGYPDIAKVIKIDDEGEEESETDDPEADIPADDANGGAGEEPEEYVTDPGIVEPGDDQRRRVRQRP